MILYHIASFQVFIFVFNFMHLVFWSVVVSRNRYANIHLYSNYSTAIGYASIIRHFPFIHLIRCFDSCKHIHYLSFSFWSRRTATRCSRRSTTIRQRIIRLLYLRCAVDSFSNISNGHLVGILFTYKSTKDCYKFGKFLDSRNLGLDIVLSDRHI